MKPSAIKILKMTNLMAPVLKMDWVRSLVKKMVSRNVTGPGEKEREEGGSHIWGEVKNSEGKIVSAYLTTPEGYTLTALTSLLIAQKVNSGDFKPGYQTPASAYGEDLILEIEGTEVS